LLALAAGNGRLTFSSADRWVIAFKNRLRRKINFPSCFNQITLSTASLENIYLSLNQKI
jgi:hypothetical protein